MDAGVTSQVLRCHKLQTLDLPKVWISLLSIRVKIGLRPIDLFNESVPLTFID